MSIPCVRFEVTPNLNVGLKDQGIERKTLATFKSILKDATIVSCSNPDTFIRQNPFHGLLHSFTMAFSHHYGMEICSSHIKLAILQSFLLTSI